jgi:hypothetical protein
MERANMKRTATSLVICLLLLTVGCGSGDKALEATVAVDFGPANRAEAQKTVRLPERSTVFEALRAAYPVVTSGR